MLVNRIGFSTNIFMRTEFYELFDKHRSLILAGKFLPVLNTILPIGGGRPKT